MSKRQSNLVKDTQETFHIQDFLKNLYKFILRDTGLKSGRPGFMPLVSHLFLLGVASC